MLVILLAILSTLSLPVFSKEKEAKYSKISLIDEIKEYRPHGFLDYNVYHDTRNFGVSTLNASLNLPGPFSYFSLTNWQGNPQGDEAFDYSYLYITEQNLFCNIADSPFDAHMQFFSISGDNNDALRFGLQTKVHELPYFKKLFKKLNASYKLSYFAWQVDHIDAYAFQIQHVWNIKIFPKTFHDRVYIT